MAQTITGERLCAAERISYAPKAVWISDHCDVRWQPHGRRRQLVVAGAVFATDATVTLLTRMARGERCDEAHRTRACQRSAWRWQGERNGDH